MVENLKSAIETRQDQDSSGHWRMHLTIKIVMRIGATLGCSGCAGSRSHKEACQRSEQELDQLQKMTVELQQPTVVLQQEPSPSPFCSRTAPMQEPTQNIQNELMDSPMEMEAQEHREQRKVRLNETLSSEMSKRSVVKAKPAHSPTIAPIMESLGSIVLFDPAPCSKDEATGSLHAIDGIDVVTALVPEDVWQSEVMKTCAREILLQDGEHESVATVNREDPSVSKTINVCEARAGEKPDSKVMPTRKAKEVQEFDEFEVKMKVVDKIRKEGVVKMGGSTKGSKQALVRVVWSHQYSIEIKDQVYHEMWMVEWLI